MARSRTFFLDEQRTQVISVMWNANYRDVVVTHNGYQLAVFPNKIALEQGGTFQLYDGTTLSVFLKTERLATGLCVEHNGKPLKGSFNEPETMLRISGGAIFIVAVIDLVVFTAIRLFNLTLFPQYPGVEWIVGGVAASMLVLGFCAIKLNSTVALTAAVLLTALDCAATLYSTTQTEVRLALFAFVFKVFALVAMTRGFKAIRLMRVDS